MKFEKFQNFAQDSHLPGESFGNARRTMPFDRPSDDSSVEDFLDKLFTRLTKEENVSQFIAMMDAGVEIDMLIYTLVESAFGEGKINANMVFLTIPPLTVMLFRMADAAGITPVVSTDKRPKKVPEILLHNLPPSSTRVEKAVRAAKLSKNEIANMPKRGGLMKRPEGII